ncbi:MAG: polyprenyl synthetase family protein [Trebonia sp.]
MPTSQLPAGSAGANAHAGGAGQPGGEGAVRRWRQDVRCRAAAMLAGFVRERCAERLGGVPGAEFVTGLLAEYAAGGKYVRSTFAYLGWLAGGAGDSDAALRAAASMEMLHAFALLQDDVMDRSPVRRGRPAAHVRLADWRRAQGAAGDAGRFGESAAVLLGDLCLVWAEQLLRESGLGAAALSRAWPYYDTLRGELAVGQLTDLAFDARCRPGLAEVLEMSRRKSGNYTVRRPLELGAALAGCDEPVIRVLGVYGGLVGEAFQMRDDVLGVFGKPDVTGKPSADDLRERKATSLVVLAGEMASPAQREQLDLLCERDVLTEAEVARWRGLIEETGAAARIEQMIGHRVAVAWASLDSAAAEGAPLDPFVLSALRDLAVGATCRDR